MTLREMQNCWDTTGGAAGGSNPVRLQGFECIIRQILNLAVQFAGIAVFIMFIMGGFKYLTAGGDAKKTEAAQKTITSAIFGLALLLGGWLILLLIKQITGVDTLGRFTIPEN